MIIQKKEKQKFGILYANPKPRSKFSKKQKKLLLVTIGTIIFIGMFLSIDIAHGWRNNHVNCSSPISWEVYKKGDHYGTHDWIADFALEKLIPYLVGNWIDFWTVERERIYLYATEGPDNGDIFYITKSGQKISGEENVRRHHIHWKGAPDDFSEERTGEPAAYWAGEMARRSIGALKTGECELAAFYLGQMTHYIADVSSIVHVISDSSKKSMYVEDLERIVVTKTDGTLYKSKHWERDYRESWFRVEKTIVPWVLQFNIWDPESLAIQVAYQTYYGDSNNYDAYEFVDLLRDKYYRLYLGNNWLNLKNAERNDEWRDHWPENDFPVKYKFFKTLENNLNLAIDCCAGALNWVMKKVPEFECNTMNDKSKSIKKGLMKWMSLTLMMVLMQFMSFLGTYAAIYGGVNIIKN